MACTWRFWEWYNVTSSYIGTYGIETLLHEMLLQSPHRWGQWCMWRPARCMLVGTCCVIASPLVGPGVHAAATAFPCCMIASSHTGRFGAQAKHRQQALAQCWWACWQLLTTRLPAFVMQDV